MLCWYWDLLFIKNKKLYYFNFRISNATDFIKQRLNELKNLASTGYLRHEPKNDDYTVRSLKPVTYRILHLFLHSNLYMLFSLNIYSEVELTSMLGIEQNFDLLINMICNPRNLRKGHLESKYKKVI